MSVEVLRSMPAEDLEQILDAVRTFVREQVVPIEADIEEKDEIPSGVIEQAKAMGLYGFTIPEEFGGLGLTVSEEVRLVEELGYTTPSLRSLFGTNNGIAGQVLMKAGTPDQQAQWLPGIASGAVVASFALTEESAGSDPSGMRTTARRADGGWRIDGTKRFITNAPLADVFMVFAKVVEDGAEQISVFLVPRGATGLSVGPPDAKMGQKGAWTAEVVLDGVEVEHAALIGGDAGIGSGYRTALSCLAHGRVHISAMCVGMMQRLLDESTGYAAARLQGGRVIGEHQLVQAMIADIYTDLVAGRALLREAAAAFDAGIDRNVLPASTKYFCSEAVDRCADRALQIYGGSGYMRGVPVERMYRDSRLFRIYEGTTQVQQLVIGRALVKEEKRRQAVDQ